jgi:hypothetical protein
MAVHRSRSGPLRSDVGPQAVIARSSLSRDSRSQLRGSAGTNFGICREQFQSQAMTVKTIARSQGLFCAGVAKRARSAGSSAVFARPQSLRR